MKKLSYDAVPGSKSIAQRALICAALCKAPTILKNVPDGDDVKTLIQALRQCGVKITSLDETTIQVVPPKIFSLRESMFQVGHGGTPLRFLISFLGLVPGEKTIDGSDRLRQRPISSFIHSLKNAGADIDSEELPLTIKEYSVSSDITLDATESSQFLSSVLLSGTALGVEKVTVTGKIISSSYIHLTQKILADFGVTVEKTETGFFLSGTYSSPEEYFIEPDWANAGYLIGAALLQKKEIFIPHLSLDSSQPDARIFPVLKTMGATAEEVENGLQISAKEKIQSPGNIDCELFPDSAQTLAVLAAFCENETTILTGLYTLPFKECDRLKALSSELSKMGIQTEITSDSITIHGGIPNSATIETYNDHRMAMAFGMVQVYLPDLKIKNSEVVSKSFPGFWKVLDSLNIQTKKYFVIGDPVVHSLSPELYRAVFQDLKIDASFEKQTVFSNELEKFIFQVRSDDKIQGLAITAPLKKSAALLVDNIVGESARSLQNINTLWKEGGKLLGTNTDVDGIKNVLSKHIFPGAKILLLGAGDTAESTLQSLLDHDGEVIISNRTPERAEILAQKFSVKTTDFSSLEKNTSPDIFISTLPFGCEPEVSDAWIGEIKTVFCVGYGKTLPPLLSQAKRLDCNIITGGDFLLAQWEKQFMFLFGEKPSVKMAKQILATHTPLTQ